MKFFAIRLSALATAALLMFPPSVQSQTAVVTTLYNFIGNGTDGVHPQAGLVQGSDGNFYGTTASGGGLGYGTVFRITPAGVFTTLHSFTGSGTDGASPVAGLIQGSDGNFYGTTNSGGDSYYCNGTVFQITPSGVLTTLHSFTETGTDGANPTAGLVQGVDGKFYGTTHNGSGNLGTVFSVTSSGEYTTLHSFSGSGLDGEYPDAGLVQGSDGNFYGTTVNGGGSSSDDGTVFRITPAGDYTTLHSFTSIGLDGQNPHAGLIQGSDGNFYGTTASGGEGDNINGTVFKITPTGSYYPVYSFDGTSGAQPYAGLIQGSDGNLYGTTEYGGNGNSNTGTAFQVTLAGVHTVLHSFTNSGTDGGYPDTGLIQGSDGNFYGTTPGGGSSGQGTIYRLTIPALPTVTLVATTPTVTAGSGNLGVFTLSLSAVQDHDVTVNLTIMGSAINGSDYVLLKSTKKIKAGKTSKPVTIIPLGEGAGPGVKRVVALVLAPGADYTVGTTGKVKVKIFGQ